QRRVGQYHRGSIMSVPDRETMCLAALLHDLGKFWQRGFVGRKQAHEEYSRDFVEEKFRGYFHPCGDYLAHAIAQHHRPRVELDIEKQVILSDRRSANEREREDRAQEEPSESPLLSPFSRLDGKPGTIKELRYPLGPLSWDRKDRCFPQEQVEVGPAGY